jgi:hypothetical protein
MEERVIESPTASADLGEPASASEHAGHIAPVSRDMGAVSERPAEPFTVEWLQEHGASAAVSVEDVHPGDLPIASEPEPVTPDAKPFTIEYVQELRAIEQAEDDDWDALEGEVPDRWQAKFTALREGYKSLETDHYTLRDEYDTLEAAHEELRSGYDTLATEHESLASLLDGLNGEARDEDGNLLHDENGEPIRSAAGFVSQLHPTLAKQLLLDLWAVKGEDGLTGAQTMFRAVGLDPSMLAEYQNLTQNPFGAAPANNQVTQVELTQIPEHHHDTYQALSPMDKYVAQLTNDPQELENFLADRRQAFENRQLLAHYDKAEAERVIYEQQAFQANADRAFEEYATRLRQDGLNSIVKSLSSQVQFSADPQTNDVQTHVITAFLGNLLNPDLVFASQGALDALGVRLGDDFYNNLSRLTDLAREVKWREAVAANPAYAQYRDDRALRNAQKELDGLYAFALVKFNGVALKLAKVLAGSNQQLREVERVKIDGIRASARPHFGSGSLPVDAPARPTAKPFTVEYLQQARGQ